MVVVRTGHVGGTRGSGIVCSTADELWMSVVCEMRGVGGVCKICMYLARVGVGEGVSGCEYWVWGFTNPVGIGGVFDVCLCCGGVGGVGVEWVERVWRGDVMFV